MTKQHQPTYIRMRIETSPYSYSDHEKRANAQKPRAFKENIQDSKEAVRK